MVVLISLHFTITGVVVGVDCLARCLFTPDSEIDSMLGIVGLGGVSI